MENKHLFRPSRTIDSELLNKAGLSCKGSTPIKITLITGEQVTVTPRLTNSCVEAFERFSGIVNGVTNGGIGLLKSGAYVSESERKDGKIDIVTWDGTDGRVMASVYDPVNETSEPYCVKSSGQNGSAILMTMIPALNKALPGAAFSVDLDWFEQQFDAGYLDAATASGIYSLCEHMRLNIESEDGLPLQLDTGGNVNRITPTRIQTGSLAPQTVLFGSFSVLASGSSSSIPGKTSCKKATGTSFSSKYTLNAKLTDAEKAMIPQLDDSYIIPQEVEDACEHIQKSSGRRNSVRNLLLRGPAGTGKTTMAKAIASGLALPYCKLTCNANTEIFDLLGQLFPDSNDAEQEGSVCAAPKQFDVQEMVYDPQGAFEHITGQCNDAATPDDCFQAAMAYMLNSAGTKQTGGQTYSYVESDLIRAMRYGWVVEIQEPSVITQPSVLVGLNGLLERNGSITLPNGEVIQRHPNCVVVMTTNVSYEGCRDLNQSVIDRCQLIMQIDDLSSETMVNRAMAATGCDDDDLVRRMVEVVQNADAFLQQRCITDGVVGMRGLLDWIESTEITGDPYKSALMTIINRATSDTEDRVALIEAVLEPAFTHKRGGAA